MMKRVVMDEVQPEMVLARPVTNATGMPIMAAGVTLNEATIDRLQRLGISAVYVVDATADRGGKTLAEQEVDLDRRFSKVIHDPLQQHIAEAIRAHLREIHGTEHEPGAEEGAAA